MYLAKPWNALSAWSRSAWGVLFVRDERGRYDAQASVRFDMIDNLAPETIPQLRGAAGVTVEERPGLNVAYLAMNNQRAGNRDNAATHAEAVREVMPWHRDACSLLVSAYRNQGEQDRSQATLADCHSYFPSQFLR